MKLKIHLFCEANRNSPVVYFSADPRDGVSYRLQNGKRFDFNARDAREIGVPRFAHLEAHSA